MTNDSRSPSVSIVVANWNGSAWIARCVSSLLLSARASRRPFELVVVDDASDDDSAAIVAQRFPAARLLRNARNIGFGATTMRGVRAARGEVVVLCNNDLAAQEHFVGNLARWFDGDAALPDGTRVPRRRLFAVSSRTMAWSDGKANHAWMGAAWRGGRIAPTWRLPEKAETTLFVQAGAAAYDRAALLRLGGLCDAFKPGYWEDYDLAWNAASQGLACIYDPEAIALHHGGGSMTKRFGAPRVARMKARNHVLFEWINVQDAGLLARYAARLPFSVAREWLGGREPRLTRALLDALRLSPAALRERLQREPAIVADAEILRRFGKGEPVP